MSMFKARFAAASLILQALSLCIWFITLKMAINNRMFGFS